MPPEIQFPWNRAPFCQVSGVTIAERPQAFSVYDNYPVTDLHSLILPRRHVASFFELTLRECEECIELLHETRDMVRKADGRITGFNVGINDGRDAGQTISHCHIHLIPRRKNDVERPMGGIRHVHTAEGALWQACPGRTTSTPGAGTGTGPSDAVSIVAPAYVLPAHRTIDIIWEHNPQVREW